jgi:hypothetical protein
MKKNITGHNFYRWYTSSKTLRLICGILIILAANILSFELRREQAEKMLYPVLFVIIHGYILGTIVCYVLYGVNRGKKFERVITGWVMYALLAVILLFSNMIILPILSGVYVSLLLCLIFILKFKINGDNKIRGPFGFDDLYFTYVNEKVYGLEVYFPLDRENCRLDRGKGRIKGIGKITGGKYKGNYGVLIQLKHDVYLCPVDQIKLTENIGDVIAGYFDEITVKVYYWESGKNKPDSRVRVIGNEGEKL